MPRPMRSLRNRLTVIFAMIVAGAIVLFLVTIPDLWVRLAILAPFLVGGLALSGWGVRATKQRVRREAQAAREGGK